MANSLISNADFDKRVACAVGARSATAGGGARSATAGGDLADYVLSGTPKVAHQDPDAWCFADGRPGMLETTDVLKQRFISSASLTPRATTRKLCSASPR